MAGWTAMISRALLLTLLCAAPVPADTGLAVDGRAVGLDGRGLDGARVELRPVLSRYEQGVRESEGTGEPPPDVTAVTREDGRFRLAAPRPGMWTVTVRAAGSVPVRLPLLPLLEPVTLPDAGLQRDAGLRVRVEDVEGHPIPGARVIGEAAKGETAWQPLPRRAVAGPDGEVHLARVEGETLRVWAVAEGFAVAEERHPEGESRAGRIWAGERSARPDPSARSSRQDDAVLRLRRLPPREIVVHEADGSAPAGVVARDASSGLVLGVIRPGRERTEITSGAGTALLLETADGRRAPLLPRAVLAARLPAAAPGAGRVLDPERHTVAGAWVWPTDEPALAVRSDARGTYRLPAALLAEGLKATAAGFRETALERVPRLDHDLPALTLWPAASVSGTVVDLQGRPVEGALVLIADVAQAWTSAAGTFRLSRLSAGSIYRLTASHPRLGMAQAAVDGKTAGVRLVLRPGASVTGAVVDEQDRPASGVEVEIVQEKESLGRTRADSEGRFVLSSLPPGPGVLRIRRTGAQPFDRPGIEIPRGGTADLGRIVLPGGATLTGRTTDPDGLPLPGSEIWIADEENPYAPWPAEPSGVTGADGAFTIGGLPSGELHVAVCRAGSIPQVLEWSAVPREPVSIPLAPASRLTGTVADPEGRPVAGARVFAGRPMLREGEESFPSGLDNPPCDSGEQTVLTDAEGRFTLAPLEPDLYVLFVEADGFLPRQVADTEARAEGQADLAVVLERGASLSGRVTDLRGEPIQGASLSSFQAGAIAETDADGRYRIEGIATGKVNVYVSHMEFEGGFHEAEIAAGENTLDVQLAPSHLNRVTYEVSGRVIDPQGGAVLWTTTRSDRLPRTVDGVYSAQGLSPGTWTVTAERTGDQPSGEMEVSLDGTKDVTLEMRFP
jgi:protocatechuate 3,4-dioxygenase beta subunit